MNKNLFRKDLLRSVPSWSSLVKRDEQLDRPNSQTTMEFRHACVTHVKHKHNSFQFGPLSPTTEELHVSAIRAASPRFLSMGQIGQSVPQPRVQFSYKIRY